MKFMPRNRHLLIEEVEKDIQEQPTILLPEDYKPDESRYMVVDIMGYSPDCMIERHRAHRAVINKNMIEEVEACGHKYKLILENYVLGFVEE